ncbi:MAG: ABC transporter permease [Gemmataceae bacterium]
MSITDIRSPSLSPLRAWGELVLLSVRRQARMRQMVWIALALLSLVVLAVGMVTYFETWELTNRRARLPFVRPTSTKSAPQQQPTGPPPPTPRYRPLTYMQTVEATNATLMRMGATDAVGSAIMAGVRAALPKTAFVIFSRWVVFAIFQSFLMPLLTLSFATDALGGERENRTLTWLFTRPLPKPSVYLAKYVAALPWCIGFNVLGFAAICLAAGEPGRLALRLFWPAVIWGSIAYAALFHLIAATFRRPAVVGLIYSFFFETLVGDLPGDLKRMSLSFYIRSLMFDSISGLGASSDQFTVYNPVGGWTAWGVLAGAAVTFTLIGMIVFSRTEYREDV